jgi:methionyl-tRNA formyltransferase
MRLVYFGTPEMAVPPLRALHAAGHEVVLVVTGVDKRRGRRGAPSPNPVKVAALELGLPVAHDPDEVLGLDADLGVVVAYGRLIRPHQLAALDMVNLHFSLLPRWRGAAPVERALLEGDDRTGVCLMAVEEGLDTGCVYRRVEVPIGPATTAAELRATLVDVGTDLLVRALAEGLGACEPQPDQGITHAAKLSSADLQLDWARPAPELSRVVRVGGAWSTLDGARIKVHAARVVDDDDLDATGRAVQPGTVFEDHDRPAVRCGGGALVLQEVQPAGKATMGARDWANGARPVGRRLGS